MPARKFLDDLDLGSSVRILNLLDPTAAQHAATKAYADAFFQSGTRASRPAANTVAAGTFYRLTDKFRGLYQSDGTTWHFCGRGVDHDAWPNGLSMPATWECDNTIAMTANTAKGTRWTAPCDGTVNHIYGMVTSLVAGNMLGAIYDDTATTRNRIATGVSVAAAAGAVDLGDMALTVAEAQCIDFACNFSSALTISRASVATGQVTIPSTLMTNTKLGWSWAVGSFTMPSTASDASLTASGSIMQFLVQFTPV